VKTTVILGLGLLVVANGTVAGTYEETMAAMKRTHEEHMQFMDRQIQLSRQRTLDYQQRTPPSYNGMKPYWQPRVQPYGRAGSSYNPYATPAPTQWQPTPYPGFASGVGNSISNSIQQGIAPNAGIPSPPSGLDSMTIMGIEAPSTAGSYVRDPR
jgi:hypothetical protein